MMFTNINDCNPGKISKILFVFGYMVTDMISNKKLAQVVTELSILEEKLNISLASNTQFYFAVPKNVRLSWKCELQQIAFNHSSDIDYYDFMKIYQKCTNESF